MITGRQALSSIESSIASERTEIDQMEAQLRDLLGEEEVLRKHVLDDFRRLAQLRLDELREGRVLEEIDRVERQALSLLAQRDQAKVKIDRDLEDIERELASVKLERDEKSDAIEALEADIERAEDATHSRLAQNTDFTNQTEAARKLDIQAANAEEKASQSEAELSAKRAAYEKNALFMYLWKRKYRTSEYTAFPLFRWLDGRVARLIGYDDARANYSRLREIPKRLREHADRLAVEADAEEQKLSDFWQKARQEDGIDKLDAQKEAGEGELAAIDAAIDLTTERQNVLLEERAKFATGEDQNSQAAIDLLAEEFQRTDLTKLFRDAQETLRTEDDQIISTLLARQRERQQIEASRTQLKEALDRRMRRLNELGSVASDFKKRRYAQSDSRFRDGVLISMMLRDLLEGSLAKDTFWGELNRQHSRARRSAGPTMHPRGSVVFGGGRSSRRSGGFGGGARSSRGGFRTGGGF